MIDLETIIGRLQDRNLSKVASVTGLSYPTVWRLKNGKADNITTDTLRKLSDYFETH